MIDVEKIKSYTSDKKQGVIRALDALEKLLDPNKKLSVSSNQKPDSRLVMPNIPDLNDPGTKKADNQNKEGSSQENNNNKNKPSQGQETNNAKQFSSPSEKMSIEELRQKAQAIRDSAQDIIDDNDEEIPHDNDGENEKARNVLNNTAEEADKVVKEIERDIKSGNLKNDDKYKERLKKIADFWTEENVEAVKKEFVKKASDAKRLQKLRNDLRQARRNALKRLNGYPLVNIDTIKETIYRTLKNAYTIKRDSDTRHFNYRNRPGEPIRAGRFNNKIYHTPKIGFFFDYSGSWSGYEDKIEMGHRIAETLKQLDVKTVGPKRGIAEFTFYYFADKTDTDPDLVGTGNSTAPSGYIKELLDNNLIDNAIIMTDKDPGCNISLVLPGYVWLLFYDTTADDYIANVRGKRGTTIYMIDHD